MSDEWNLRKLMEPPAKPVTDADLVLSVLQAWKGDWVKDLYRITGVMVHSRIAELRRRGYNIPPAKRFGQGDYRYRLLGGAEQEEGR